MTTESEGRSTLTVNKGSTTTESEGRRSLIVNEGSTTTEGTGSKFDNRAREASTTAESKRRARKVRKRRAGKGREARETELVRAGKGSRSTGRFERRTTAGADPPRGP